MEHLTLGQAVRVIRFPLSVTFNHTFILTCHSSATGATLATAGVVKKTLHPRDSNELVSVPIMRQLFMNVAETVEANWPHFRTHKHFFDTTKQPHLR